ncbi:integrase, catalytic region, zinc finger, CCHC-type containing protein [Tanacetum coccineum]|uniref:Integrase, catalytic region, zinc finger, CCHC-type containing protein n=1 Tax=Tanacetum coccineum TaxID=301880 RepID=A0ABQ5HXJ7_9ASTR
MFQCSRRGMIKLAQFIHIDVIRNWLGFVTSRKTKLLLLLEQRKYTPGASGCTWGKTTDVLFTLQRVSSYCQAVALSTEERDETWTSCLFKPRRQYITHNDADHAVDWMPMELIVMNQVSQDLLSWQSLRMAQMHSLRKKAGSQKPKLYDGQYHSLKCDTYCGPMIMTETLELSEKSRSKMLLKEQDPLLSKERTTASLSLRVRGGWKYIRLFSVEFIPFIKELKDIFNNFNQYLVEELADVQKVFYQMEQAVEQHRLESRTFEVKMNQVLSENERLLAQAIVSLPFGLPKVIQDLLSHISRSCPSINNCGPQLIEVIPRKKDKKVRFAESLTSTENTKPASTSNIVSNKRVLHSTGVRLSTSASGSQPSGNTKNDRILQTPSSNSKNISRSSRLRNNLKKQDNSDYVCIHRDDSMSSDNLCVSNSLNVVKSRAKPKKNKSKKDSWKPTGKVFTQIGYIWRPTGRTFTIVGNACPLTRITTTNEVPSRKPIVLDSESPKPVVKLVVSKSSLVFGIPVARKHHTGDRSQLTNFVSKFLGTVKFGNDQVAKIMGFGDYQIGNVTISRVYYIEGLGHNLFSVGQFCDFPIVEVAFRQHTCFIRNLEGVDLLTGSRGDNLYTLSLGNMMASSPICLLSKASKTKSWLWHRRLSHLNFGSINHLARHGLVRGLPKLKFEKDHLCSACALAKVQRNPQTQFLKSQSRNKIDSTCWAYGFCGANACLRVSMEEVTSLLLSMTTLGIYVGEMVCDQKMKLQLFIINFL